MGKKLLTVALEARAVFGEFGYIGKRDVGRPRFLPILRGEFMTMVAGLNVRRRLVREPCVIDIARGAVPARRRRSPGRRLLRSRCRIRECFGRITSLSENIQ